jgi:D-3-phosphoglycerate dehydrogenase
VGHDELPAAFRDYDVVWMRLAHRVTADVLGPKPRCRVLAVPVTGLDHIDPEACAQRGVEVVSLRGETEFLKQVRATAELTVALALSLLRHIPAASQAVRQGIWDRDRFRGRELFGKTAGIVGMGRLGRIVADYFRAFQMRVIGYDPRPDFPCEAAERVETLGELLRCSDLVSLHVTYGPETQHLIGTRELGQMRPGAVLLNTSRGGVVDELALLQALESCHLAGAALDVLDSEPDIGPDHILIAYARRHDNLLLVPHLGGNTHESFEKTETFLAERVVEALARLGASEYED